MAARLLLFAIQKQVFNTKWKDSEIYPPLLDIVNRNIDHGVYDKNIIQMYTVEEFENVIHISNTLETYLSHMLVYNK